MAEAAETLRRAFRAFRPPAKLRLSEWAEGNIVLPASMTAQPGALRLWPTQRDIADSIGDPAVPRVTVLKSVRVGYSQLLAAALGHYAVNDPAPILTVLPADDDCRTLMVGSVEPMFDASPALRGALSEGERDTLYSRAFAGGSLKLVGARAPRNLRGHTARVLFLDEVDAFEVDVRGEGDPVQLAVNRTMSFSDRKIVMGSTPLDASTSRILRAYEQSDQRVYQVQCPHCAEWSEITWAQIQWPSDAPERAAWVCPTCGCLTPETAKGALIRGGRWVATAPEVAGHHGYKLASLTSLLPNASWGTLATEFLEAKRQVETLKAWTTTLLAEPWKDDEGGLDDSALFNRREPIGLDRIPPEVLYLTAGVDLGRDRIEMTTVGWTEDATACVLSHEVAWGDPLQPEVWAELEGLLRRRWSHPLGGTICLDRVFIDSGDGGTVDAVYAFTQPRATAGVFPSKGVPGFKRQAVAMSQVNRHRLQLVGVDNVKSQIMARLTAGSGFRFSDSLDADWFEQLTAEKLVVRYKSGVPTKQFVRISGRRAEALDCVTYAWAAYMTIARNDERRREILSSAAAPVKRPAVIRSSWLDR